MSKKLPSISGKKLISFLSSLEDSVVRQHAVIVSLEKQTEAGTHKITIPNHDPVAKGTLNDILTKVSIWNQVSKEKLIEMIRE